jgi:hypothetical protein
MLNKVRKINSDRSSRLSSTLLITDISYLSILMSKLLPRTFNLSMMKAAFCNDRAVIKSSSAGIGREGDSLASVVENLSAGNGLHGEPDKIPAARSGEIEWLGRKQHSGSTKWLNGSHDMVGVSIQRRAITRPGFGDEAGTIDPDPQLAPFAVVFLIRGVVGD